MRVMAEAVEPRARAYIYAHKNWTWEKRDKLRRRHAAQLQDQSSGSWLVPRTGPRCAGVLWALLVLTARRVWSCSCHLKACHIHRDQASSALRGDASTMEEKRRCRAASDCQSRASSRSGWRHRFAPPGTPPAILASEREQRGDSGKCRLMGRRYSREEFCATDENTPADEDTSNPSYMRRRTTRREP